MKAGERQAKARDFLASYRERSLQALAQIREQDLTTLIGLLEEVRDAGRQIFLCGNGGSASTASHLANDLGKGACHERLKRFRVLSLTDNVPWITALANDSDYSQIFVEQLRNYARPGDLLVAFSGSGNSPNVVEAIEWANRNSLRTVGVTGRPGGKLAGIAGHPIFVESSHMGHIEEGHFLIQHMVAYYFIESDSSPGS